MSKNTPPVIEEIKLSTLLLDFADQLAGRNEKERSENAKELAPKMKGGWDSSQPGQYFERDGKKYLAAGFGRTGAAKLAELKTGYFVKVEDNASDLRTIAIHSNASKPISAFEQGRIYVAMRDGTNAETAVAGETIFPPMAIKDIAADPRVGKSRQHVEACIAVFENPPEIAELITSEQVSANVVKKAKSLCKNEAKLLKWLKAAVKSAESEGAKIATTKHLDAHRADFAPLKAAKPESLKVANEAEMAKHSKAYSSAQDVIDRAEEEKGQDLAPEAEFGASTLRDKPTKPASAPVEQPQGELDLGSPVDEAPKKATPKKIKEAYRVALMNAVGAWNDELGYEVQPADIERLIDAATDAVVKIHLPF